MLVINYYELIEIYINEMIKKKISIAGILKTEIENYNKILNSILDQYTFQEKNIEIFEPVFQWAQKKDYIMIEIFLSSDFSINLCKNVENDYVDLMSHGMEISGICKLENTYKKFELKISFFDEILKLNSNYHLNDEGKYVLFLKKKTPIEWSNIVKNEKSNYKIWNEMQIKFDIENKEKEEIEEEKVEKPVKKKSRRPDYVIRGKEIYKDSSYWD